LVAAASGGPRAVAGRCAGGRIDGYVHINGYVHGYVYGHFRNHGYGSSEDGDSTARDGGGDEKSPHSRSMVELLRRTSIEPRQRPVRTSLLGFVG
jgi:hypothetical protein